MALAYPPWATSPFEYLPRRPVSKGKGERAEEENRGRRKGTENRSLCVVGVDLIRTVLLVIRLARTTAQTAYPTQNQSVLEFPPFETRRFFATLPLQDRTKLLTSNLRSNTDSISNFELGDVLADLRDRPDNFVSRDQRKH